MYRNDHPTATRSPWQNGHAERLIGSIRRECLDHTIVFAEAHLRRVLKAYVFNTTSSGLISHWTKDASDFRREPVGNIATLPVLGGLHHQ
jgi:hypothetical protein